MFDKPNGAFTGEISAEQLKDSGIGWTLTGHSERRVILGEDDSVSEGRGLQMSGNSAISVPVWEGGGADLNWRKCEYWVQADRGNTCELVRCTQDENRA